MENKTENNEIVKTLRNNTYMVKIKDSWGYHVNIYIPKFNSTEHALEFGKQWNQNMEVIAMLEIERSRLLDNVHTLNSMGRESEAMYLSSGQCQLVREALEEAIKGLRKA